MKNNLFKFLLALTLLGIFPVHAQSVYDAHVEAELIPEDNSIQPGRPLWFALRMKMDNTWHIYWKNPGDSGLAPVIHWNLPEGFQASEIYFPYPHTIVQPPLTSFGYEGEVFLLSRIDVPADLKAGESVEISAKADWLACEVPCIPGHGHFSVDLPVSVTTPMADPKWKEAFAKTRRDFPVSETPWTLTAQSDPQTITLSLKSGSQELHSLKDLYFFPESSEILAHAEKQLFNPSTEGYQLVLRRSNISQHLPDVLQGVLVSSSGWDQERREAWSIEIPLQPAVSNTNSGPIPIASGEHLPLVQVLWFAFLGGMILNLMPCVFPVLSLKVLTFVNQARESRHKTWQHGLIFTLGVLVSFWVLAGLLFAIRAGGEQIGWGFQFQSPVFLVFLSSLFFLFALNLFGIFEIGWTVNVSTAGSSSGGWTGAFLSGVLATVVATPCTAPFMGSALGFALTQPPIVAFMVFTFLGLGLAFPYLLLSRFPALLKFIPKPGLWMIRLKQFLGFWLLAAVIWLLWILGEQLGIMPVVALLSGLLLMGLGAWIFGLNQVCRKKGVGVWVFLLLVIAGFFLALQEINRAKLVFSSENSVVTTGIPWENYSPEVLAQALQQDQIVFLDFTAAWCLTCKVNERIALDQPEVIEKFKQLKILPIKVDWTSRNEEITRLLATFGKNSIPLYVIYRKDRSLSPMVLPEVLTPQIVIKTLEKLEGGY